MEESLWKSLVEGFSLESLIGGSSSKTHCVSSENEFRFYNELGSSPSFSLVSFFEFDKLRGVCLLSKSSPIRSKSSPILSSPWMISEREISL